MRPQSVIQVEFRIIKCDSPEFSCSWCFFEVFVFLRVSPVVRCENTLDIPALDFAIPSASVKTNKQSGGHGSVLTACCGYRNADSSAGPGCCEDCCTRTLLNCSVRN